ncbi:MAG: phosphate signaling complex protein PhoU [Armatimonadetes bacterium]|nr:phosphate signaling complex protein PhoU [Armatimonadota bacterium]
MEHQHARQAFDNELLQLEHDLLDMGSRAEAMVARATEALVRLDETLVREVFSQDDEVDTRDKDLEARCLRMLALQSPTGPDLRVIGTVLKVTTDIERVGDLAVDIARCTLKIERELGETKIVDIPKISLVARHMFRKALEAFVKRDLSLVREVVRDDDDVDALYRDLRDQIHDNMRKHPDLVVSDSWLLLAVHHFERIADHAVNIAERVEFLITGSLP